MNETRARYLVESLYQDRKHPVPFTREQIAVIKERILVSLTSQLIDLVEDQMAGKEFYPGDVISFKADLNSVINTYLMFDSAEENDG